MSGQVLTVNVSMFEIVLKISPVNRITDRCKNITLAKTSFRPVINIYSLLYFPKSINCC